MVYKLIIIEKSQIALIYFKDRLISLVMEHNLYRVNDIYLGRVSSVLTSLDAAFVTLNPLSKNGFISFNHLKDRLNPDSPTVPTSKNILVQITREPIGNKGPTLSCDISLIGRYIALFPFSKFIHSLRRLHTDRHKEYLRAMAHLLVNPKDMGMVIEFKTMDANVNFLIIEAQILKSRWTKITAKARKKLNPSLVSKRKIFLHKILQDHSNINFDFIAIDSYEGALKIKTVLTKIHGSNHHNSLKIEFHKNYFSIITHYLVDVLLLEIMKPKINLCRGGYIIIEKTEALTTVDVNSGSLTNLENSRQTSLWVNYSAVHEIVKQIRLRNIGGIIVIDFIDCNNHQDQMKLLRYMSKLMLKDYVRCRIIQMSELGLVELTRSRQGQSVYDAFSRKCNTCNGLGYLTFNLTKQRNINYELLLDPLFNYHKRLYDRIRNLYNKVQP
uniref:Ribonuclease E n=1 Tax=Cryptomonas curvata TaxID=233186 RepID=A0A679CA79_9CRYP|nr:ribonuclease E [Cryptomonas curvata]